MLQSLLLGILLILCLLLILSLIKSPLSIETRKKCDFKILQPKYRIEGNKKYASFNILVKNNRYFVDFPLLFKFYSDKPFKSKIKIWYSVPDSDKFLILEEDLEYTNKTIEYLERINVIILGKLIIDIELEINSGSPIIQFEMMRNQNCILTREHKLELKFPD